jgi:hypothetical protein
MVGLGAFAADVNVDADGRRLGQSLHKMQSKSIRKICRKLRYEGRILIVRHNELAAIEAKMRVRSARGTLDLALAGAQPAHQRRLCATLACFAACFFSHG